MVTELCRGLDFRGFAMRWETLLDILVLNVARGFFKINSAESSIFSRLHTGALHAHVKSASMDQSRFRFFFKRFCIVLRVGAPTCGMCKEQATTWKPCSCCRALGAAVQRGAFSVWRARKHNRAQR